MDPIRGNETGFARAPSASSRDGGHSGRVVRGVEPHSQRPVGAAVSPQQQRADLRRHEQSRDSSRAAQAGSDAARARARCAFVECAARDRLRSDGRPRSTRAYTPLHPLAKGPKVVLTKVGRLLGLIRPPKRTCANCHRFDYEAGQRQIASLPPEHQKLLKAVPLERLAGVQKPTVVELPSDLGLCREGPCAGDLVSPAHSCSAFVPRGDV